MVVHFEELWEQCEKLHHDEGTSSTLIDELMMKLNLYKAIDQKSEIPKEESQKIKARTMGEILLTITNLSLIDNINVFNALNTAKQFRSAEIYSEIPEHLKLPG
jgi:hypothetical protein